MLLVLNDKL